MKREILIAIITLLSLFLITPVLAADVGYLYRNYKMIDWNIVDAFEDQGLSVTFIHEDHPGDLSEHGFLFAGTERLRKIKDLNEYNAIIMNNHGGKTWGLTNNGVPQIRSNRRFAVKKEDMLLNVYMNEDDKGRTVRGLFYYLPENRKASGFETVAMAYTGRPRGDIVSYAPEGSELTYGKTAGGNLCFFGIVQTEYWTDKARELFEDCISFVHPEEDEEIEPICGNEIVEEDEECDDGNTADGDGCDAVCLFEPAPVCGNGIHEEGEQCDDGNTDNEDGCDSLCMIEEGDEEVQVHDIALVDFSTSVNAIKIEDAEGVDILETDELICDGRNYRILIKVTNEGTVTKNITFEGTVDGTTFSHVSTNDLEAGESTGEKVRTVAMDLAPGNYNVTIVATTDLDEDLSDNIAVRAIVCADAG